MTPQIISALETALEFAKQGVHPSEVSASLRFPVDPNGDHVGYGQFMTYGRLVDVLELYAGREEQ